MSGYRHAIYNPLEEAGWERVDLLTVCYAVGRTRSTRLQGKGSLVGQSRTESIWISPTAVRATEKAYVQGILSFGP
jgi:DNA adenine methylase